MLRSSRRRDTASSRRMMSMQSWRERLGGQTQALPSLDIHLDKTALLLIDMQNYAANPESDEGTLSRKRSPEASHEYFNRVQDIVIPNQQSLLEFWRDRGMRVIYLTAGAFLADGQDMTPRRRRRDADTIKAIGRDEFRYPGLFDYKIVDPLAPRDDELVIPKNSLGAFSSSPIDQLLRNLGITGLVIGGVVTEACVETTAREAADRGYDSILVEDACASNMGMEQHEATLLSFARFFGEV